MTVKGYKAFNSDWTCGDKRYEVGKTYHEDNVELCEHGMHFCKDLEDVFRYYEYVPTMRLATVEASGTVIQNDYDSKCVTSDLKVVEELNVDSEAVQLEAVKQDGCAIFYIRNPSEAVQLEAVKQDGWNIQFIDNPSEKIQLEAVKQNYLVIPYIDNPSEAVKLEAVKEDGEAIDYIRKPAKGSEGKKE